jgi:uncharacterized protein Yka (UPF0111/DUF47 family)
LIEDIYSLITAIDNVAINLHKASSKIVYQVEKITNLLKLTEINLEACQLIDNAVKGEQLKE